ncbi:MAG: alpha-amylase [Chlorobi bacterium]|nr:alpha-amylase [Chlorobiota bacterium]
MLIACNSPQDGSTEKKTETTPGSGKTQKLVHPDWSKNANIYEVNIRQYSKEGTFKAFEEHLPRLKKMDVDILWLMPIFPISEKNRKGSLGSYYAVRDYRDVNPEFGTMDDFRDLVDHAHQLGFKVILDWVANHSGWDNQMIFDHPDWYTHDSLGKMVSPFDWTDVADLNYESEGLRDYMIGSLKFWVTEFDIDGYRCDVAGMVPTDFWERARKELDGIKPVFMLAEAEQRDLHEKAFDMTYAWELHHIMNDIAEGKKDANDIEAYIEKDKAGYPPDSYRMNFITNHDENSWNGTVKERMGDSFKAFAMLTYTLPGMPLVYSGQEIGLDKRLEFFEKDEIEWDFNSPLIGFYTKLNNLKTNNKALWNGLSGGDFQRVNTSDDKSVLAFVREKEGNKVFVIVNLGPDSKTFDLTGEKYEGGFMELFSKRKTTFSSNTEMTLEPWGFRVFISI